MTNRLLQEADHQEIGLSGRPDQSLACPRPAFEREMLLAADGVGNDEISSWSMTTFSSLRRPASESPG